MTTTQQKDTIIDYIDTMAQSVYTMQNSDISMLEREKLLREVGDDLYNLKNYILNEVV
jgi:hypothetical protein